MTTTHFTKLFAAISTFTIAACASSSIYAAIPTVGIYDENGNTDAVDVEATGNSQSLAQTKTDLAAAFAADTGGVWDFDTTVSGEFDNIGRDSFDLTYGTSQSNTLNLSVNGKLNQSNTSAAISGGSTLSFNSTQGSRVFTPDVPLLLVA
ncbi:MAG: hypothetical protein MI757_10630, partial [Pirellulales bacterium]|nr:hypothetical protein [Pirellulales bacterium]